MNVNGQTLNGIFVNLKSIFNNAFAAAPTQFAQVAMVVPSTGRYNDYRWLGNFPKMEKWVGKKNIKKLDKYQYQIVNDDFAATIEVKRNDIEDDQLGIYAPQAQSAGFSAKQMPDELVFGLLANAFVAKCFDGKPFISDSHPIAKGVASNKGKKALRCDSVAAAQASYGAARVAMRSQKDDEGRPLNVNPDLLVVPPALEDTANTLMTADRLEDGKPNPYKGTAKVLVAAWLTDDAAWFLLDTSKPVKPLIYQERKKPVFVQMTNPESANVFLEAVYLFGAEARAAVGFGYWQLAYGSTGEEQ